MIRRILISTTVLSVMSSAAFAQTITTVVNEAVPNKHQPIIANSPQDLALQEEIRKIRAFNAKINVQPGTSDTYSVPAPNKASSPYEGRKIELYETPTRITYATASGRRVAVVPTTITVRKPAVGYTRIHRVIAGDTLYNLATRNCISVAQVKTHNALSTSDIKLGQVLTLPASQCGAKTLTAKSQTLSTTRSETITESGIVRRVMPIQTGIQVRPGDIYAVLPKDTLYSIGKRYCVKADALAQFNGLNSKTAIQPGQRLRLPGNACIE